jgi:hypothetical protein
MRRRILRDRVNRDRRDQAYARSVIAEATRQHNAKHPLMGKRVVVTIAGREMFRGVLTLEELTHLSRSFPASHLHIEAEG